MGKDPSGPPAAAAPADDTLAQVLRVMLPLAQLLLRNGVSYGAFADALKPVFVTAARQELERGGMAVTQSSLSVLSGVHRKDVRHLADAAEAPSAGVPLASQVATRWLSESAYRLKGKPRRLPRTGPAPSFEALARSVSTDVHPRTVLDELVRLGAVQIEPDADGAEFVVLRNDGFVPAEGLAEMLALFSANASDHVAAAVHNLSGAPDRFLEQSVFANGMTAESAEKLAAVAREAWAVAFRTMVDAASERVAHDADIEGNHRIRFGAYFYSEPPAQPAVAPARPAAARRRTSRGKT